MTQNCFTLAHRFVSALYVALECYVGNDQEDIYDQLWEGRVIQVEAVFEITLGHFYKINLLFIILDMTF